MRTDIIKNDIIESNKVEILLFSTLKCNLRCSYCVMKVGDMLHSQGKPIYSINQLYDFINTNLRDKEIYFTFFEYYHSANERIQKK